MLSFDCEGTGIDLWHGCLPFSMQAACSVTNQTYYAEWPVDPFTRLPEIDGRDLEFFATLFGRTWDENRPLVFHHTKIDVLFFEKAWEYVFKKPIPFKWYWDLMEDSLVKSHALRNLWSHSLKDLRDTLFHIPRDAQDDLRTATNQARRICMSRDFIEKHGQWRIAGPADPHWPAIHKAPKEPTDGIEGWWFYDTWLPAAIARLAPEFLPPENECLHDGNDWFLHPWQTVVKHYALEDADSTVIVNEACDDGLVIEGLNKISQTRHKLIRIFFEMEKHGITFKKTFCEQEIRRYQKERDESFDTVKYIADAAGKQDFNPNSPKQLQDLLYTRWHLPVIKKTATGQASTDAGTLKALTALVEEQCPPEVFKHRNVVQPFLSALSSGKLNETAADYSTQYLEWSKVYGPQKGVKIHASYNLTGTRFTRQSARAPNLTNVATGKEVEDEDGDTEIDFRTRDQFCPANGSEWLSLDFQSIEFLVWGYSCGNKAVIDCYERGEPLFRPIMEAVWDFFDKEDKKYKKSKNGIYSRIYGASHKKSDVTFGRPGATAAIEHRMPEIKPYTKQLHQQLMRDGYIETLSGYRLYVEADEPHKVVSAKVQGHAGYVIGEAMIACDATLQNLRKQWDSITTRDYVGPLPPSSPLKFNPHDVHILLQIHDELIFEGPIGFARVYAPLFMRCMRESGEKYGIPTPVNSSIIPNGSDWGHPQELKL